MKNTKEKAVKQALATLNIDKIPISSEFLETYCKKHDILIEQTQKKLTLKKGE